MNEFNTPWFAWPTTAAIVGVAGAVYVAWRAYKYNLNIRLRDTVKDVREQLELYYDALSLALCPSPNLAGERFEKGVGGWDGFCKILNILKSKVEIMEIYGGREISTIGGELISLTTNVYIQAHNAITDFTHGARSQASLEFLTVDNTLEIKAKWRELKEKIANH